MKRKATITNTDGRPAAKRRATTTAKRKAHKTTTKMDAMPTNATTLLNLNDDCLLELYRYLDLVDLDAVANACTRLKWTTQDHVKRKKDLIFPKNRFQLVSGDKGLQQMSQLMHNYGEFLKEFEQPDCFYFDNSRKLFERQILSVVSNNCTGNLAKLKLEWFDTNDVDVNTLSPLIGLEHLTLCLSARNVALFSQLSRWCPNIKYLELQDGEGRSPKIHGWDQTLHKLEEVKLCGPDRVENSDVAEMMKNNPTLIKLRLFSPNIDLRLVAALEPYLSRLELLHVAPSSNIAFSRFGNLPQHFGQMTKLTSLRLALTGNNANHILSAISNMATQKIPLTELVLSYFGSGNNCADILQNITDTVSKMKNLKELCIYQTYGFNASQILTICRELKDLLSLNCLHEFKVTPEYIEELTRSAKNLQRVFIDVGKHTHMDPLKIDGDCFRNLVKIVKSQSRETTFEIKMKKRNAIRNFPSDLAKEHAKLIAFNIIG